MQSVILYGRLLARAVAAGVGNEFPSLTKSHHNSQTANAAREAAAHGFHLVTASCGYGNHSQSASQVIKKWSFGDDACFIAKHKLGEVVGVADGVGGWRSYGVDPSKFSRNLMLTCERLVREGHFRPQEPAGLIAAGYAEILEAKDPSIGSCTACLVALHREEKTIYTANLGDSGFIVVRSGQVVHRSEEQQHYFNTPFQLSVAPPTQRGQVLSDSPDSAEQTEFPVQKGDIILLGTDGLFDNLTDDMILDQLVGLQPSCIESVQKCANQLVAIALQKAFDPEYMSPFCLNAREHGIQAKGGKPDDITVLLATVQDGEIEL